MHGTETKVVRWLAILVAAPLIVAACGGGPAATPTPASPAAPPATAGGPSPTPELGALPAPEGTTIRIGVPGTETGTFSANLADMVGIYDKYGLQAEITVFDGAGKTLQALQAGQLDVIITGVGQAIASQLTDAPLVVLGVSAVRLNENFYSIPEVKSADDLRGKAVAISSFGSVAHGETLIALKELGLTSQDVVITQVGNEVTRFAALIGKSVAAAPLAQFRAGDLEELGYNELVTMYGGDFQFGRSGINVRKDWYAANPNTALVVVASFLEAQNMFWTEPDVVAQNYAEFAQIEPGDAADQVTDFQNTGNRSLAWEDAAFENAKAVLQVENPDLASVPVDSAFDRSVLEKLVSIGFYDRIGSPAP